MKEIQKRKDRFKRHLKGNRESCGIGNVMRDTPSTLLKQNASFEVWI